MTAIVWFSRDLRVHDQPALRAALDTHDRVVPVFCLDERLLHGRHASGPRTQFLLECLQDLDGALRKRGGGLVMRHGPPERELARLAEEVGAGQVHASADVGPFARRRQDAVRRALDCELVLHPGIAAVDDLEAVRTQGGKPYTVFSPFHRNWLEQPRRELLGAPRKLPSLPSGLRKGRIPSLSVARARAGGGGSAARRRAGRARAAEPLHERGRGRLHRQPRRPRPGQDLAALALPALRLPLRARGGGAPARAARAPTRSGRQLCWRDFYMHVLRHFPRNARSEFQERYRGKISWSYAERRFEAWCEGRTGYPLVDAGMRQLRREGWMHNRARLVVGSFLTKDLGIDWRWGERWFMRLLLDGDEANNNGNWQWIASVGVDPQPFFRRIYNPARHMERFDPRGDYVRRYVPELREVPDDHLAEPWTMPEEVQRECGCVIGEDYPEPIVDHREARREAFARYGG